MPRIKYFSGFLLALLVVYTLSLPAQISIRPPAGGGGTPGGSEGQLQINQGGAFAGVANTLLTADEQAGVAANSPSAANPVLTQTQGDTYLDGCSTGLAQTGSECEVDDAVIPTYSTGTTNPATCTAGREFFLDTDDASFWRCSATDTWTRVQNYDANFVTAAGTLTSNLPMIGGGSKASAVGTRTGNTTNFASATAGAKTNGNYPKWDADGNLTDGDTGGGVAGTNFQEFPFDGSATIGSVSNAMAVADRVYVQRVKFDRTLTSPTAFYFSVATGSGGSTWYFGIYTTDGNTRVINCSGSGASAVTVTCSTGLATVTAGDYFYAYAASDTTTGCAVTTSPGAALSESASMRGYATNTVSGGSLPTTLGAITYTGANQEAPCKAILATF